MNEHSLRNIFFLLTLIFFFPYQLSAQAIIKGNIKDVLGNEIPGVSVLLMNLPDSSIVDYALSDINGRFYISHKSNKEQLLLSVKGMMIKPQLKQIKNQDQEIYFIVEEDVIELKEVVVKASRIWGQKDTLNYLVSAFSNKNDVAIGDVLKKMPGIMVSESGQIYYQGKTINKFYVENLDLLGGRYGIATNNIPAKSVATVQVMENHQPIKVLDSLGISSTDAAINLKLKEEAKGVLTITGSLGIGGFPLLWENELTGMYFTKKKQNITTYKGNNAGADLSRELTSFDNNNNSGRIALLNATISTPPEIKKNRYLFNNSNAFTFNNLFKLKNSAQVNVNILYMNDYEQRNNSAQTSYFLPQDSILIIKESIQGSINTNRINAEFKYNLNQDNNYLDNKLSLQGIWVGKQSSIASPEEIKQQLKDRTLTLSNQLYWIRRSKNGFELNSHIGFNSTPQKLIINPGLYDDIFNQSKAYYELEQNSRVNVFNFTNNLLLYSVWKIGKVFFDPSFGNSIEVKNLKSDIYTTTEDGLSSHNNIDSMRNDLNWIKIKNDVSVAVRYTKGKLNLTAYLPISYYYLYIKNKPNTGTDNINRIYSQPTFAATYDPTYKIKLKGSYYLYRQVGDINTMYTGYILEGYRNLNHYDNNLYEALTNGLSVGFEYKDPMRQMFANGGINYNRVKRDILYGQELNGILTTTTVIKQPNSSDNITFSGQLSKGFDFMRFTTTLSYGYSIYESEQLRQSELIKYNNESMKLALKTNFQPASWIIVDYDGVWNQSWGKIKNGEAYKPIRTLRNTVSSSFLFCKEIAWGFNYEYYYNSAVIGNRYMSFADFEVKYTWKGIGFFLNWNNIFNTNEYVSAYYNEINSYIHAYKIRDRSIMFKIRTKLK